MKARKKIITLAILFNLFFLCCCSKREGTQIEVTDDSEKKVPISSKKVKGKDYSDIEKLFSEAGFTNIEIESDYCDESNIDDGEVFYISINDIEEFSKGDKFDNGSIILIKYNNDSIYNGIEYDAAYEWSGKGERLIYVFDFDSDNCLYICKTRKSSKYKHSNCKYSVDENGVITVEHPSPHMPEDFTIYGSLSEMTEDELRKTEMLSYPYDYTFGMKYEFKTVTSALNNIR